MFGKEKVNPIFPKCLFNHDSVTIRALDYEWFKLNLVLIYAVEGSWRINERKSV